MSDFLLPLCNRSSHEIGQGIGWASDSVSYLLSCLLYCNNTIDLILCPCLIVFMQTKNQSENRMYNISSTGKSDKESDTKSYTTCRRLLATIFFIIIKSLTRVPKYLRHKVSRVHPRSLGIDPTQLPLVVVDKLYGLSLEVSERGRLGEGGHLVGHVLRVSKLKTLELHRLRVDDHG
jgi:hypothetical protein